MVLITLRNTDSMNYSDYRRGRGGEGTGYFPIEQTKALIDAIRTLIDVPVAVGGFGFSLLAKELMPILRPDFGVYGGADAFFLHFEDILLGNYQHVSNLLYFQEDAVIANKRIYFPPPSRPEYTSQAIEEMIAFYKKFPEPGFQGAPVEIMRGCSHTCVFCAEPFVAGRQVQYRDLSAIMGDIELLVNNGVTEICMIMSELNPEGNGFILRLADKIRAFNEQKPAARKLSWFGANYLLTFDRDDYRRLYASGFKGGWFDITALDDENARAMRTPYWNDTLVGRLQNYAHVQRSSINQLPAEADVAAGSVEEKRKVGWSMFLGNPATTMKTIRKTLAVANGEGLATSFDSAHIIRPLRVFDYERPSSETLAVTFSVNHQLQRVPYQQTLPSFAYPPAEQAEKEILGSDSEWGERPSADQAKKRIDSFLQEFFQTFAQELAAFGLPGSMLELEQMTPYSLAETIYARWLSAGDMANAICEQAHLGMTDDRRRLVAFFVKVILYRYNVRLLPAYRALFVLES
jgi:hypothetical protein